ncbi:hypothetical protein [Saccharolobus islandicus]|uniref:Uncharacterized protein n=1 Tax=Saccharolobus islandicus (strain L.D.8.5 / Lassen \|nr:hypothetical protein [Sulfolobus islandicus]ADB86804.1 hypothetical protein LD85_1125 [Sulfolobus islandicus L.D.8.5]
MNHPNLDVNHEEKRRNSNDYEKVILDKSIFYIESILYGTGV